MYRYRYIYMYMYIYIIYYNLSRSNEPPPVVPKRKSSPEGERLGGSEHQPSFILFILGIIVVQSVRSIEFSCWVGRSVSAAREPRLGVEELINAK